MVFKANSKEFMVISKLVHFTSYQIEIHACNHPTDPNRCSMPTYVNARTLPERKTATPLFSIVLVWIHILMCQLPFVFLVKADKIVGQVTHEFLPDEPEFVYIKWQEPKAPNGMIILYEVKYMRMSDNYVCVRFILRNSHILMCISFYIIIYFWYFI